MEATNQYQLHQNYEGSSLMRFDSFIGSLKGLYTLAGACLAIGATFFYPFVKENQSPGDILIGALYGGLAFGVSAGIADSILRGSRKRINALEELNHARTHLATRRSQLESSIL